MTPSLAFDVAGARELPHAAAPTIVFDLRASDDSGLEVYTVALNVQVQIAPNQRLHDEATREKLRDVFGGFERWGDTARGVPWAQLQTLVPGFRGSTSFGLAVPCNADLELATTRYFEALPDRAAPIVFHFSGSVFYCDEADRLKVTQVSWSATARYELPVDVWHAATAGRGGVVRVADDTFAALKREQHERGLPTIDAVVSELLAVRSS